MKKLVATIALSFSAFAMAGEPPANYQQSCFACHFSGAAGAPKTGDAAAWEPRMAKGMDALVAAVRDGMGAMPPTGLCASCSDEDYKALIEFMAAPAEK